MLRSPHLCRMEASLMDFRQYTLWGQTMGLPAPTFAQFLELIERHFAERRRAAEKSRTDRVMTRQELIKHGLLPDKDVH